ncbi:MAG: elongation factor P [Candidatus Omnitrophica bacterium]|nr:elongation factor P [Candidatus Omnitrophota bacterium]
MITPKQFKNGQCVIMDGELYFVISTFHKRTAQRTAVVRTKLRNAKTGLVSEFNLDPGATFKAAYIDKSPMEFMYRDGDSYHFMDKSTYEQFELSKQLIGGSVDFLKENSNVTVDFYEGKPIGIELPIFMDLKVTYTEPGLRGDTAKGGSKPATLETGTVVKVPLFINQGNIVRIDTRTGEYVGRV